MLNYKFRLALCFRQGLPPACHTKMLSVKVEIWRALIAGQSKRFFVFFKMFGPVLGLRVNVYEWVSEAALGCVVARE